MTFDLTPKLTQNGRASVDFLAHLFRGSETVRNKAKQDIELVADKTDQLPEDLDERTEVILGGIEDSRAFRVKSLIGEWHANNHGGIATKAFEDVLPALQPALDALTDGTATLHLDPDFKAPPYWEGVNFHRTEGGWDGHKYAGFIHGEIIHRKMVDALYPGGIFAQRLKVANMAPKGHYDAVLDMGCSTGHFTLALQEAYPKAKITGVDLSAKTLEHAHRVANSKGYDWDLYQRSSDTTGFEDNSFDLTASYILLHEMPERVIRATFKEAFRVLKSGGDMIMSDVTRYADMDKLGEWQSDYGAQTGGEPHWRASASLDLAEVARSAGFVDVNAGGEAPYFYPHVVSGRKP